MKVTRLELPRGWEKVIGLVIGKGGEHIKRIEADSGAKVRLDTQAGMATFRGDEKQVRFFKFLNGCFIGGL